MAVAAHQQPDGGPAAADVTRADDALVVFGITGDLGAVNPALTAMANALRVGDHLLQRMAVGSPAVAASPVMA